MAASGRKWPAVARTREAVVPGGFWRCGQTGHRKTVSFWSLGSGGGHLLSTYYVPGQEEEHLLRSCQPWGQGLRGSGQKASINHLGFPGAPRLRLQSRSWRVLRALLPPDRSIWEPEQPAGQAAFHPEGPAHPEVPHLLSPASGTGAP